ncbi:CLUMA_CG016962, isoform A [Clunio marinus]|uniref:CLUMA_CG016962, isoform A n=1 Tax=Clunio marinus TaxID=568069 RepID=A0A1J1IUN5_9DIPT|nr:CLUMA_CG016962, isoform A [Clunio marinus]
MRGLKGQSTSNAGGKRSLGVHTNDTMLGQSSSISETEIEEVVCDVDPSNGELGDQSLMSAAANANVLRGVSAQRNGNFIRNGRRLLPHEDLFEKRSENTSKRKNVPFCIHFLPNNNIIIFLCSSVYDVSATGNNT